MRRTKKLGPGDILNAEKDAITLSVQARTTLIRGRKSFSQGTAIPIRIGKRFFFATAGHVVDKDCKFEIVSMKLMKSLLICPIKKGISKKEDVAYLEVPGELSNSFDFNLDETGIITSIKLGLEKPVFVVGYPFKWIDPTRGKVEAFTLESVTVPTKEYPKWKGLENQFRARIEFLIAYDPVPGMRYLDLRDAQINAPVTREPPMLPGMSGCGIWISRLVSSKAGVRSAGPVLCGLQTGRVEKHLRATRIRFWLELVGKDYPDLATIIEKVKVNRL